MDWFSGVVFSYSIFLVVYALVMFFLLFFAGASLYHLLKYGFLTPIGIFMTFLLVAGTATILFVSFSELRELNWSDQIIIDFSGGESVL